MRGGVHDGHSARFELLWVSVDESVEEVGEGVEAQVGSGGELGSCEELLGVEGDGGVVVI